MAEAVKDSNKKKAGSRGSKGSGLQLGKLIINVIRLSGAKKGISVVAIKKALKAQGVDVKKYNTHINRAIIRLKDKGVLVQVRGFGASGSFKLAKTKEPAAKPKPKPARRPAQKKAARKRPAGKKPSSKKSATGKKTAAGRKSGGGKKSGGKPAKKSSPAKVRKVDTKKKAKRSEKKKSPKKSTKNTPVKKSPVKKSAPRTTGTKRGRK